MLNFDSFTIPKYNNMHTILGANGIIGEEAHELRKNYTDHIKLVGRNPIKTHLTTCYLKADLLDPNRLI
jgi:hypothetical protein